MRNCFGWLGKVLFILALAGLLGGCGGSGQLLTADSSQPADAQGLRELNPAATQLLPGTPQLIGGAGQTPSVDAQAAPAHATATAGLDFAANRMIVYFKPQPDATALAPYLGGGADGQGADALRPADITPLVDHPYFRRVSANLAKRYSLALASRVFFRNVNFAVYEVPGLASVTDLDNRMLQVLHDNPGLVESVSYDTFMRINELSPRADWQALSAAKLGLAQPHGIEKHSSAAPNDPMHLNKSGPDGGTWANWRVKAIDGAAWNHSTGSSSVVVAVLDTGVRMTHQDLAANVIVPATTAPYNEPGILTDVVNLDNDPSDDNGHGTNCAGCVGAVGNNGIGLAGMCWSVKILPLKVMYASGGGFDSDTAQGMLLADYLGAEVQSISISSALPSQASMRAARQVWNDGGIIFASASNDNTDAPYYPAYYSECIAVGATTLVNASDNEDFSLSGGALPIDTRYDARATFSNYGSWVDLAAPGVRVRTPGYSSDTAYDSNATGTSFSCPYVAGCAALLWAYMPSPTNAKVRAVLQASATPMDHFNNAASPKGFIDNTSNGTVRFCNIGNAMDMVDAGTGTAFTVTWDNPVNGATINGTVEIRTSVNSVPGNSVVKVEYETDKRMLGVVTAASGGFFRLNWDTTYEFNRTLPLTARVYDTKGNITVSSINVTTNNTRVSLPYTQNFTGVSNDAIPAAWFRYDGNDPNGKPWGANSTVPGGAPPTAPALHSSGTNANYITNANQWLFAPVIDLRGKNQATISFKLRYQVQGGGNDYGYFMLTDDDESYWYSGSMYFNATTLQDWGTFSVSVPSWMLGHEVRLAWVLIANSDATVSEGLWIDDLSVTSTATGTPPTVAITSPADGATVNGVVTLNLSLSADVTTVRLYPLPPQLGYFQWSGAATSLDWDSRWTYNGACLLTVLVYDAENNIASDSVAVTVNNSTQGLWLENFESIGTLGGFNGNDFDGLWFIYSGGTDAWHISTQSPHGGTKCAKFGPVSTANYGSDNDDMLFGPVHDCSALPNPRLRLWQKLDLGTGDVAQVQLMFYNGVEDVEVPLAEYHGDIAAWTEQVFNLEGYRNTPFRVLLRFMSDADSNTGKGWYIDDYELFNATPLLDGVNPGRRAPGGTVTLTGTGFGATRGASEVRFNNGAGGYVAASTYGSWSATSVTCTVPNGAATDVNGIWVHVGADDSNKLEMHIILPPPGLQGLTQR